MDNLHSSAFVLPSLYCSSEFYSANVHHFVLYIKMLSQVLK